MPSTTRPARSTRRATSVRVHGAEVSTERDAFAAYAETIALLFAIGAVLVVAWIVMAPRADADLVQVAPSVPVQAEFPLAKEGQAVQPLPDGPGEVTVVMPAGPVPI